jgi:6-phosphogluconolactonase (cycloisomerase 2 family)
MKTRTPIGLAAGALFALTLTACGGGGNSTGSSAGSAWVSGTAAYGRPVAGQTVSALDFTGRICATATTAADGTFTMYTSSCAAGAVAFYVSGYLTPGNAPLDAIALPPPGTTVVNGIVNIDPLTTLIAYDAAGLVAAASPPSNNDQVLALLPGVTAAQYQQAKTDVLIAPLLQALQTGYGITTTGFDPVTSPFVANGQGVDGFFDAYALSATPTAVQLIAPSSVGAFVQVTLPTAAGHPSTVASTTAYMIGGTVSGLTSGVFALLLNGNPYTLSGNGPFTFPTPVASSYNVTIGAQPTGQTCTVSNGSGSGITANVSTVSVTCSVLTYTISGSVAGLTGGSLTLQNNGADSKSVSANGSFTFATPVAYNGGYAVTVSTQPAGQTCTVSSGSGTNVTADISSVSVTCSAATYTIGGSVTGLQSGTQVTLDNNSADPTIVTSNTTFSFATKVAYTGSYTVTVGTQPNGQTCTVSNGSGTNVAADVSNVSVSCSVNPVFFYIGNYGSNNVLGYEFNPFTGSDSSTSGSPYGAGTYDRWVTATPAGTFVYTTNQNSANVSGYSVNATTGALTPVPGSPFAAGSVPTFVITNAAGTYAYVTNNSSANVSVYSIDQTTGALTQVTASPFAAGTVPAAVAINPAGTFAYVVNRNDNTISAYSIDQTTGALTQISGSPFANAASVGNLQSITINSAGTFAYGANGYGTVSGFSIDPTTGALTALSGSPFTSTAPGGSWVEVNPAGTFAYLAAGNGGYVTTFSVNSTTGALTQISGGSCGAHTGMNGTNYIKINPAGTYAYMPNGLAIVMSVCSINASTGALTDAPGSPFYIGARPLGIGVVAH